MHQQREGSSAEAREWQAKRQEGESVPRDENKTTGQSLIPAHDARQKLVSRNADFMRVAGLRMQRSETLVRKVMCWTCRLFMPLRV